MSDISTWSPTAPGNNVPAPDGWEENGQAPGLINNTGRETHAAIRRWYEERGWHDLGDTITYISATTFQPGTGDKTSDYRVGDRLRATGTITGTIYGTIAASVFSTNTTVTAVWDAGALSNEALTVSLGIDARTADVVKPSDLGTAATRDLGVLVGNVPNLEDVGGSPGLPAVNGSQLTVTGGLLETLTASSSVDLQFTTAAHFASYAAHRLVFEGITASSTGANFWVRVSVDGGSSYITTAVYWDVGWGKYSNGENIDIWTQGQGRHGLAGFLTGASYLTGETWLYDALGAGSRSARFISQAVWRSSTSDRRAGNTIWCSVDQLAGPINAIQIRMSTGNIAAGTVRSYGLRG